jgi:hypothetical protein
MAAGDAKAKQHAGDSEVRKGFATGWLINGKACAMHACADTIQDTGGGSGIAGQEVGFFVL